MATLDVLLLSSPWVIRDRDRVERDRSVAIVDGLVASVGPADELMVTYPDLEQVDCRDTILLPAFVNGHNHIYEILCRGLGKHAGTEGWLRDTIYPMTRVLTEEDYYWGARLGAADCLRTGTTAVVSQLTNFARFHADAEARAFADAGIRARVVRASSTASTIDERENADPDEEVEAVAAFLERWEGHERVAPAVGPGGLYSCDPTTHQRLKRLARDTGSRYFTHLGETRNQHAMARERGHAGQIAWAHDLGILDETTVVAHAVWATDAELDLLAETGATVVHNPSSNMVLASGVADVPGMLRRGVHVTIGTDGPASNDSQDMVAEMKAAVLLQRVARHDPSAMDAPTALHLATAAGARIFDLAGDMGRIDPGQIADLVGVGFGDNVGLQPVLDPVASLVYHGSGRDVTFTMVAGRFAYRSGVHADPGVAEAIGHITTETVPRVRRALKLD